MTDKEFCCWLRGYLDSWNNFCESSVSDYIHEIMEKLESVKYSAGQEKSNDSNI